MSTGEDVPRGQSLRARLLMLKLVPGDVLADLRMTPHEDLAGANALLTRCQDLATKGVLAGVTAKVIRWMEGLESEWWENLPEWLDDEQVRWRRALEWIPHARSADAIADLWMGVRLLDAWLREAGIDSERRQKLLERMESGLTILAEAQCDALTDADPIDSFFVTINEMLDAGRVVIPATRAAERASRASVIGYQFGAEVGLIPGATLAEVKRYLGDAGGSFPHTKVAFGAMLAEAGELVAAESKRNTRQRRIEGKAVRLWMLSTNRFPALHLEEGEVDAA